jgi:glycosyltransferase involved in cell wall biosynthesis
LAGLYRDRGFFPRSRLEILPNPVSTIPQTNRCLGSGQGPLVIVYAGQLEEHKGIRFLREALADFPVDFVLHIAGEGTLVPYVASWADADPRVVYHGFISLQNLNDLLAIADVAVVPSLCYENSPTVIYESFGVGVPVIASDIGGIGELVVNGKNGFTFIPGDQKGFLSCLKRLLAQREDFWKRCVEIRKGIEAYSIVKYTDTLERLIRETQERRRERDRNGKS